MKSQNYFPYVQHKIAQAFEDQDPELSDVIFEIDGNKLYAHKFFLSIISDTFKAMLSDRWNSSKNEPIVIKDYKFEDFKEFISFLYTSECNITDANIYAILDLAEFYHIDHLKELCNKFLLKMKFNSYNIFNLMDVSNKYSLTQLKEESLDYIVETFNELIKCKEILNVDKSIIEELVKMNFKYIKPESKFKAAYAWAEHQATKNRKRPADKEFNKNDAIKAHITPFLPNIEFKKMHLNFLREYVEKSFLFTDDELKDILENANPDIKVTVTNSHGEILYGFLDSNVDQDIWDFKKIEALKNRQSDNTNDDDIIYWNDQGRAPLSPFNFKNDDEGVEWTLYFNFHRDLCVAKRSSLRKGMLSDCFLAKMTYDSNFSVTTKCKVEIE